MVAPYVGAIDEAIRPAAGVVTTTGNRNGPFHALPTAGKDVVVSVTSSRSPAANGVVGVNTRVPPCTDCTPATGAPATEAASVEPVITDNGVGEGSVSDSGLPGATRRGTAVVDANGNSNACSAVVVATSSSPSNIVARRALPVASAQVLALRPWVVSRIQTRSFAPASSHGPSRVTVCGGWVGATQVEISWGAPASATSTSATLLPYATASRVSSTASALAAPGSADRPPSNGSTALVASRISSRDCHPLSTSTYSLSSSRASARAEPLPTEVDATTSY